MLREFNAARYRARFASAADGVVRQALMFRLCGFDCFAQEAFILKP
jgi:hypothetical protein